MVLRKFFYMVALLSLVACEGLLNSIDCINPHDFGNQVSVSFVLPSNPYEKDLTNFVSVEGALGYNAYEKQCNDQNSNIAVDSKEYFWLDTGVDVINNDNLSISLSGSVDFCKKEFFVNDEENTGCSDIVTKLTAHPYLPKNVKLWEDSGEDGRFLIIYKIRRHNKSSIYNQFMEQRGNKLQPLVNKCANNDIAGQSSYYIENHKDFVIMIPKVKNYTDQELSNEVNKYWDSIKSEIEVNDNKDELKEILKARLKYQNSHSISGNKNHDFYAKQDIDTRHKYILEQENSSRTWYKAGEGILVYIDNLTNYGGAKKLTDTTIFAKNPAPPTGIKKECANNQQNEEKSYYYEIEDYSIDSTRYNYCEYDIFHYIGNDNLTGYVKFRFEEEYKDCIGAIEYCYCPIGQTYKRTIDDYACATDSSRKYREGGCWVAESNGAISSLLSGSFCTHSWYWHQREFYSSSYIDNYGEYNIRVKGKSRGDNQCVEGINILEYIEVRIGDDLAINKKMSTEENGFVDGVYKGKAWNQGRLYVRVVDPKILDSGGECAWKQANANLNLKTLYRNNDGSYKVSITTSKSGKVIQNIKDYFFDNFSEVIIRDQSKLAEGDKSFTQKYHESLVSNSEFQSMLTVVMVLYITIFGISFLMGLSNMTQGDLFMRVLKIGIIYSLLLPGSWEFFNNFVVSFEQAAEDISLMLSGHFTSNDTNVESSIYSVLDQLLFILFQPVVHAKATSVFFSPILIGIVLGFALYYAFFLMIYGIGKSIIIYLLIKIIFTILFMIAPIFIIFMLFEQTKGMFEKWLNMLISYSTQLIFLFLAIAFFSYLILEIFYNLFSFGVCWKPVWIIKLGPLPQFELFSYWRFWGFDPRYSEAYNVSKGPDFISILFFLTIAYCFKNIIDKVTNLGDAIAGAGGVGAGSLATNLSKDALGAIGKAMGFVGGKVAMPILSRGAFAASKVARTGLRDAYNLANLDQYADLQSKESSSSKLNNAFSKFYQNSNTKRAYDAVTKKYNPFYNSSKKKQAQQDAYNKVLKKTGNPIEAKKASDALNISNWARVLRTYDNLRDGVNYADQEYQKSNFHETKKKIKASFDRSTAYQRNVDKLNKLSSKFYKEIRDNNMPVDKAMEQFTRSLKTIGMHPAQLDIYNKRAAREFGEEYIRKKERTLENLNQQIKSARDKAAVAEIEKTTADDQLKIEENKTLFLKESTDKLNSLLLEKELQEKELEVIKKEAREREGRYQAIIEAEELGDVTVQEKRDTKEKAKKELNQFKKDTVVKNNKNLDMLNSYRSKVASLKSKEIDLLKKIRNSSDEDKNSLENELQKLRGDISTIEGQVNSFKANE
jgi:type IV secretory pathway VirB6-like protein